MRMFVTEIPATTSDGKTKYYEGVLIQAKNILEAQKKEKTYNPHLEVVGEYISSLECENVVEF